MTTTQITGEASAPASFAADSGRANGYYIHPDPYYYLYDGYAYYLLDMAHPSSPSSYGDHFELWYEGEAAQLRLAADRYAQEGDVHLLFMQLYISKYLGASWTHKYVIFPVSFTATKSQSGDLTLTCSVDKSFWRNAIVAAFPDADFSLQGANVRYTVAPPYFSHIASWQFNSFLPSAWSWTPVATSPALSEMI